VHAAVLGAGAYLGTLSSGGEPPPARVFNARFAAPVEVPFEEPARESFELVAPPEEGEPELRESEAWSAPEEPEALGGELEEWLRPVQWLPSYAFAIGVLGSGETVAATEPEPTPLSTPPSTPEPPAEAPRVVEVVEPRPLDTPPPVYPPLARRNGEEGSVLLRLRLDERGAVVEAVVVESSGSARLDRAASAALALWRFEPRREDGRAVAASVLHRITFRLAIRG
jgi:protein TonB